MPGFGLVVGSRAWVREPDRFSTSTTWALQVFVVLCRSEAKASLNALRTPPPSPLLRAAKDKSTTTDEGGIKQNLAKVFGSARFFSVVWSARDVYTATA